MPRGESSVIPQACSTLTPYLFWKSSITLLGQDDPPITTRLSELSSFFSLLRKFNKSNQTVGTAAVIVTPFSSIEYREDGLKSPPGKTIADPTNGAV